jgi:diadenosine tetraphosphatase ApaH/serine/threonine PP2A family protein phosphatase
MSISNFSTDPSEIRSIITAHPSDLIPEQVIVLLLSRLTECLIRENNVLLLSSPLYICGDVHGQLPDLLHLLEFCQSPKRPLLFLGDYVDRGIFSLHTFLYLACLKIESPDSVFLLRGNHESRHVTQRYGFFKELSLSYGGTGLWSFIHSVFDLLPLAALIDRSVFCVHGGISPSLLLVERISLLNRRQEVPDHGPMTDLLWSDPATEDGWSPNRRGAGYTFGPVQSRIFCHLNQLDFIARAHEVKQEGFEKVHLNSEEDQESYRVVTLFSAPVYGGKGTNKGAMMRYNEDTEEKRKIITFGRRLPQFKRPPEQQSLEKIMSKVQYSPDW